MAAPMRVDRHVMDQLIELQNRSLELRRHWEQLSARVEALNTESAVMQLTLKNLETVSEERLTYKPVGRMFLLQPRAQLQEELTESLKKNLAEVESKMKLRERFYEKLQEAETQRVELLKQAQTAS